MKKSIIKKMLAIVLSLAMIIPLMSPAFASTYPQYTGSSRSIVDALNVLAIDSSYAHREEIAKANGIYDYSGTAEQNNRLLVLLRQGNLVIPGTEDTGADNSNPPVEGDNNCYPACSSHHTSLVDALSSIGVTDTSFNNRSRIAAANGIVDYEGSAIQNTEMLRALKEGRLRNLECVVNGVPEENSASDYVEVPVYVEESYELPLAEEAQPEEVQPSEPVPESIESISEDAIDTVTSTSDDFSNTENNIDDATQVIEVENVFFTENENITVNDESDDTETEEFICYNYEDCTADDSQIFIITKNNAPIRTKASNSGKIVSRAKAGQLVSVSRVFMTWKFTKWCELNVPDTDQKYYIYLGNVEEHDDSSHTFINVLTTGKGSVFLCSTCGISKAMFAEKTTVCDLTCVLEQAVLGSFSNQTASFTSVLAQIIVSELPGIGTLADARDIVGDIVNGAPAWVIAADCIGLIPIVGALKFSDEIAIITKNSDELLQASAKSTPDLAKKIDNVFNGGYNVKIAGRGSTGRTIPANTAEKIVMENTLNNPFNPGDGNQVLKKLDNLGDERWKGWEKWEVIYKVDNHRIGEDKKLKREIVIHFNYDPINNMFDDFKFKNKP